MTHGGIANDCGVEITYVNAEDLETGGVSEELKSADAVLVPGAFGKRGGEGKILAVQYAREQGVTYLGICIGLPDGSGGVCSQ